MRPYLKNTQHKTGLVNCEVAKVVGSLPHKRKTEFTVIALPAKKGMKKMFNILRYFTVGRT
jgi:hypothetical protein